MNIATDLGPIDVDLSPDRDGILATWEGVLTLQNASVVTASGEARNSGTGWSDAASGGRRSVRVEQGDTATPQALDGIADAVLVALEASAPFAGPDAAEARATGKRRTVANLRVALDQALGRVRTLREQIAEARAQ